MRDALRQAANVVLAVAQVPVGYIAGRDIGPTSDRYPTYVLPADYAFAIWSLIFGLTIAYAVYQALPAQRARPLFRRIGWLTASAFLANCVWMIVFPRGLFVLSVAVIVWLLVSLVFVVAGIYQEPDAATVGAARWLAYATFSIFLGWVSIATAVNIAQTLTAQSAERWWAGTGVWWGVGVLLVVGAVMAVVTARLRANFFFAATVVWALVAVIVNQLTNDAIPNSPTVAAAAGVAALMVVAALFVGWSTRKTRASLVR